MQFKIPHKRSLLCTAVSMSLLPLAGTSLAQDDTRVEEVVVTGSFIRRSEGFTSASQTTQLSAEDLAYEGTLNIGTVVQNLSFVNGAASSPTNTIQGTSSRTSSIDLRGLGARSTLTLLDGKRLVTQNVNVLIPTIAIQRMDIVADGAAALYGSDAVAGVVNFVPFRSYDGIKIDTYAEQDARGDYDEQSVQMMWGGAIGDLDVVLAGQYRQNSRLGWDERNVLTNSGLVFSNNGPGNWTVPQRDASGQYTGATRAAVEPTCAPASQRTDYQNANTIHNEFGMALGSTCWFDFGDNRSFREPTETTQFFANATWDVSDDLTLSGQAFRTRMYETTYTSTSNPGNSRIGELPAVRGEIPGNPFRARDASGNQLFGVDANGDGIPDRNPGVDLNNDGWDDYIVSGIADNGIPLNEDVQARLLRPINKTHRPSAGHSPDLDNLADNTDTISRVSLQADFTVPFISGWEGQASYTRNEREFQFMSTQNFDIEAMKQGLRCDVVNDRDACYNPFMVTDPANQNSLQVMDAIAARNPEWNRDSLDVVDLIFNGEIPLGGFELPGGPIGAAFGYQFRTDTYTNIPAVVELRGDTWIGSTDQEVLTEGSRDVDAYFAEFAVPVLPSVEITAAIRREEFSTGQASTDPKFGITWLATDWLTLRATRGDAFIAPTLPQLLDPITCGLNDVDDRFSSFSAFTIACGGGNPNLTNEQSTSEQFGLDLNFGDFDFSLTWNQTDFSNRIVGISGQDKIEQDFFNFKQATGFTGSGLTGDQPTLAQLQAWINDPRSDKDIVRDPDNIATILQINNTATTNAETVNVTAWDIQSNYRFNLGFMGMENLGDFRLNLQATYIDEFLYQTDATQPIIDGAGSYNDITAAAPSIPQLKANLRLNWNMGNHSAVLIGRYVDDLVYDGPLRGFMDFFGGTYRDGSIAQTGILAWTQLDGSYTYTGIDVFDGELSFSIGGRNLTDREPQRTPEFAGVAGALPQDPMQRVFYARVVYDF